jgi:hypothetical protein
VGRPLRRKGHDVLALAEDPLLESLEDDDVLELAAATGRILVTHDVEDSPQLLREWAAEGRSHAGVILVLGIGTCEFGLILRGLRALLDARPAQQAWIDVCEVLSRARFDA